MNAKLDWERKRMTASPELRQAMDEIVVLGLGLRAICKPEEGHVAIAACLTVIMEKITQAEDLPERRRLAKLLDSTYTAMRPALEKYL